MKQFFDFYGNYEVPEFILCNPDNSEIDFLVSHNRVFTWRHNDTSELTFDYYYTEYTSKIYDLIEVKRLVFLTDIGYFQIQNITEHDDGISKYKSVTAHSIQNELGFKKILILEGTYKFYDPFDIENTFMGMVLDSSPGWSMGDIDSALWNRYRTFDDVDTNVLELLYNDGSKAYGCIFSFDFINRKISATAVTTITQNPNRTDIYISFENLVKSIEIQEKADNIYTAISPFGKDLDIRYVNPIGTNFIYNFSYYMTEEWMPLSLINAIKAWNQKISDNKANYVALLDLLMNYNAELVTLQSEFLDLKNKYKEYDVIRSSRISQELDYSDINDQLNSIQIDIDLKKTEITSKSNQIADTSNQIADIVTTLKMENNFTETELLNLQNFIIETTYTNTNYIVTDSMTPDIIQMYAQELYDEAEDELKRLSQPSYTFTVDAANFVFLQEYGLFTSQLEPGCMMYVEKDENNVFFPVLLEMIYSWDNPDNFSMTFGNRYRLDDSESTFGDLTAEVSKASSILGLNSGKWDNFNRNYKKAVSSLINDAFDAAKNEIINSTNQEIVIDASGFVGRKLKALAEGESFSIGESLYEGEQLKIIHNKLVFTDDNWDSVKTALGKLLLENGNYKYGLAAEVILGKLLAGDQLIISNENNSFYVDGSGAVLKNANFNIENDFTNITLSPDAGISIKKKTGSSTYTDIFYIDENGEAYFAGNITATSGKLGGWIIEPNGFSHSSGQYYLRSDGTGRIGLMTFTNTSATFDGNIYAKNLQAGGTSGYIGDSHIADNSISGTKLRAEYRDSITQAIAAIEINANQDFVSIQSFTDFKTETNSSFFTISGDITSLDSKITIQASTLRQEISDAKQASISDSTSYTANQIAAVNGEIANINTDLLILSGDIDSLNLKITTTSNSLIQQISDSKQAAINQSTTYTNELRASVLTKLGVTDFSVTTQSKSFVNQISDSQSAAVTLSASYTQTYTDGKVSEVNSSIAAISLTSNNAEASVALLVSNTGSASRSINAASIVASVNGSGSTIKINADKIQMTGTTTFLTANDVGTYGSTSIDGGRIRTGTIDAARINLTSYSTTTQVTSSINSIVNGMSLSVSNGTTSSTLTLKNGTTTIGSADIKITGMVTFTDLSTASSSTIINGANIRTGLISADRIDVTTIKVRSIYNETQTTVIATSVGNDLVLGGWSVSTASAYRTYLYGIEEIRIGTQSYYVKITSNEVTPSSSSFSLGSSSYKWNTGYITSLYITSLYINNTLFTPVSATDVKRLYYSTLNYVEYNSSQQLVSNYSLASLGSSTYKWNTGYITSLYVTSLYINNTLIAPIGATDVKRLYINSTIYSYYIEYNSSYQLVSSYASSSIGSSSSYWAYAYIGSTQVTLGNSTSSKVGFFGSAGTTKQSVAKCSTSGTTANAITTLNALLTALNAYGIVTSV